MNKSFNSLGLSETTLRALAKLNYEDPTPVQVQAIPAALKGNDLAITAKTGTGKTAAFALPLIERVPARRGKQPSALIITPTRELAQQIENVLFTLSRVSGHRVVSLVGGMPYSKQLTRLRNGVDIVVATPGRLVDMMKRKAIRLEHVQILVLDEADRMLDMGFLPAMETIIAATPEKRQTMLFSATMDRKVMSAVQNMVRNPEFIEVSHKGETADKVEQYMVPVAHKMKAALLQTVLEERGDQRVIVFARTKSRSDVCARELCDAGFRAQAIHSDLSQRERNRALDNFRKGNTSILVATDVLARGIDVSDVEHVINYDLPDTPDDYIHRIGRTARAGKAGDAISFVSPESKGTLHSIEKLVGKKILQIEIEGYDATQILAAFNKKRAVQGSARYGSGSGRPGNRSGGAPSRNSSGRPRNGSGSSSRPQNAGAPRSGSEQSGSRDASSAYARNESCASRSDSGRPARSENRPARNETRPASNEAGKSFQGDSKRPARSESTRPGNGSNGSKQFSGKASRGQSGTKKSHSTTTKAARY